MFRIEVRWTLNCVASFCSVRPWCRAGLNHPKGSKIRQWNTLAWLDSGLVTTNFDHHGTNILFASCNGGRSMMWLIICAVTLAVSVGVCAAAVLMQPGESRSQTEI
jgi:hypothetical protein